VKNVDHYGYLIGKVSKMFIRGDLNII